MDVFFGGGLGAEKGYIRAYLKGVDTILFFVGAWIEYLMDIFG